MEVYCLCGYTSKAARPDSTSPGTIYTPDYPNHPPSRPCFLQTFQLAYELQQGLQLLVAGDKPLLDRARAAFQSHVRAYAARAPDSRAVFQVRSLHLGHVARSFALKDPPTAVKVGKKVVRRPGDSSGRGGGGKGGDGGAARGEKRRRDGAGGAGGSVHRLGLSKQTELASRAEFL